MLHCARYPHPSVRLQEEQNIHLLAVQPCSLVQFRKHHCHLWAGDTGGSDSLLQFQPDFQHPPLQFPVPLVFPAAVPPFTWPKRFPHSSPFCPAPRMCALTWLLWLVSVQGGSSWTLSVGLLVPEAPRLTGIPSCSSATSNQSLSRQDFNLNHSWEQLPVRSETNKKTTLKEVFNQITTVPHTTSCWGLL